MKFLTAAAAGLAFDPQLAHASAEAQRVLERGVHIDQTVPGHGLGLAVSRDIAESCGGSIAIAK